MEMFFTTSMVHDAVATQVKNPRLNFRDAEVHKIALRDINSKNAAFWSKHQSVLTDTHVNVSDKAWLKKITGLKRSTAP